MQSLSVRLADEIGKLVFMMCSGEINSMGYKVYFNSNIKLWETIITENTAESRHLLTMFFF